MIKKKPGGRIHLSLCRSSEAVRLYEGSVIVSTFNPINPTLTAFPFKLVGKRRGKEGTKGKRSVKIRGNLKALFRGIHFCGTCGDSHTYYVVGREEERNSWRKSRKCCERRNYWDKSRERHQDQQYQTVCPHLH